MSTQLHTLKNCMTLPLFQQHQHRDAGFTFSPDLLATPNLLSSLGLLTPPGGVLAAASAADLLLPTPTSFLNPSFVTEEQEKFVMNFDEKIQSMMMTTTAMPTSIKNEADSFIITEETTCDDDSTLIDDEDVYQFSSETAPIVTGSDRQSLRVERKRHRNREAARRCRERKLERLRVLDDRATELRQRNNRLRRQADELRSQVEMLRRRADEIVSMSTASARASSCQLVQLHSYAPAAATMWAAV